MSSRNVVSIALATLWAFAVPASADWIKTREGALVETRGPWKVKGPMVVFTSTQGTLSSMRLSEVDLDASAVATFENAAAATAAGGAASADREPVLVLTNKDIPKAARYRAEPEEGAVDEAGEGDEAGGAEPALETAGEEPPQEVEVISWHTVENQEVGGIEVLGTVQNQGSDIVTDLRVVVRLFDDDGEFLGSANAFLEALSLAPTVTSKLRAIFPEVTADELDPRFEVRSSTIKLEALAGPQQPEGSES